MSQVCNLIIHIMRMKPSTRKQLNAL